MASENGASGQLPCGQSDERYARLTDQQSIATDSIVFRAHKPNPDQRSAELRSRIHARAAPPTSTKIRDRKCFLIVYIRDFRTRYEALMP